MLLKFQSPKARKAPKKLVEIRLGDRRFGIDAEQVVEVVVARNILAVSAPADFIRGVVNVRGTVIPIGDIRKRLGIEVSDPNACTRIVILDADGAYIGLYADAVSNKLLEPPEDAWKPARAEDIDQPELRGSLTLEDQEIPVFDAGKIFPATEKLALENITRSF